MPMLHDFVGMTIGKRTIIATRRHLGGLLVPKEPFDKVGHSVSSIGAIDGGR